MLLRADHPRGRRASGAAALVALSSLLAARTAGGAGEDLRLVDAVRTALARDPNVAVAESRVDAALGTLELARGRFDPVITGGASGAALDLTADSGSESDVETLESSVEWSQELPTGLVLGPALDVLRVEEGDTPAFEEATLSFTLRQPLLRNRGRAAVTGGVRAAEMEARAAELDLRHRVSERVLTVAVEYWFYVAAGQNLEILLESEERSQTLLGTTRRLVEADRTPAAELVQLEANLASKQSSRIRGEDDLFAARQRLGREIGLEAAEILALPPPADGFPDLPEPGLLADAAPLLDLALLARADLLAARERAESARVLRVAAETDLRPLLDLVVSPGYTSALAGGLPFEALADGATGFSAVLGLNLSLPVANRVAEGSLARSLAAERQSELAVELARKSLGADVPAAVHTLLRSSERLAMAERAVGYFETAVRNEEKKLTAGTSTVIDVISQQDRLTSSRQALVDARLSVARALLDLRFETGTLVGWHDAAGAVDWAALTTVPRAGAAREAGS